LGYVHQEIPSLVNSNTITARLLANFGKHFKTWMQPNSFTGFRAENIENTIQNTGFFAKDISKVTKSTDNLQNF
jgi:hypothetical protein